MTSRERFLKTFEFEETDRCFRWEYPGIWPSTINRWHKEGLPESVTAREGSEAFFGLDKLVWIGLGTSWTRDPFLPRFEQKVLEDEGETIIKQDMQGIILRMKKENSDTSMPQFLSFPVETEKDYDEKITPRYKFDVPGRFPKNWQETCEEYNKRDYPVGLHLVGPFGHIRNLMGEENMMYALYDEEEFFEKMLDNWCTFNLELLERVCKDVVPDAVMFWEDNCYRNGPLMSPEHFVKYMSPRLIKVIDFCKSKGIKNIIVDTDGNCRKMLPVYLDCGVNGFYPFEVTAGMDINQVRAEYGKKFVIIGGIDKRKFAISKEETKKEVDRIAPLLKDGGFIPMADHGLPFDIPLDNWLYFLEYLRNLDEKRELI